MSNHQKVSEPLNIASKQNELPSTKTIIEKHIITELDIQHIKDTYHKELIATLTPAIEASYKKRIVKLMKREDTVHKWSEDGEAGSHAYGILLDLVEGKEAIKLQDEQDRALLALTGKILNSKSPTYLKEKKLLMGQVSEMGVPFDKMKQYHLKEITDNILRIQRASHKSESWENMLNNHEISDSIQVYQDSSQNLAYSYLFQDYLKNKKNISQGIPDV